MPKGFTLKFDWNGSGSDINQLFNLSIHRNAMETELPEIEVAAGILEHSLRDLTGTLFQKIGSLYRVTENSLTKRMDHIVACDGCAVSPRQRP